MKKMLVCSMFALAILLSGTMAAAQEKGEGKKKARPSVRDANAPRVTPTDVNAAPTRRGGALIASQEERIKRLEAIKVIASGENAVKTVAELDKLIGEEKKSLAKMTERMEEGKKKGGGMKKRSLGNEAGPAVTPPVKDEKKQ
jgi:hypothetical protein